jgi:cell division protein FtsW
MTEMVYGAVPLREGEPILPRAVRHRAPAGLAASPPLAERNGFEPFHYVERQAIFGALALVTMLVTSMMSPAAGAPARR